MAKNIATNYDTKNLLDIPVGSFYYFMNPMTPIMNIMVARYKHVIEERLWEMVIDDNPQMCVIKKFSLVLVSSSDFTCLWERVDDYKDDMWNGLGEDLFVYCLTNHKIIDLQRIPSVIYKCPNAEYACVNSYEGGYIPGQIRIISFLGTQFITYPNRSFELMVNEFCASIGRSISQNFANCDGLDESVLDFDEAYKKMWTSEYMHNRKMLSAEQYVPKIVDFNFKESNSNVGMIDVLCINDSQIFKGVLFWNTRCIKATELRLSKLIDVDEYIKSKVVALIKAYNNPGTRVDIPQYGEGFEIPDRPANHKNFAQLINGDTAKRMITLFKSASALAQYEYDGLFNPHSLYSVDVNEYRKKEDELLEKMRYMNTDKPIECEKQNLEDVVKEQAARIAELEAQLEGHKKQLDWLPIDEEEENDVPDEGFENDLNQLRHSPRDLILLLKELGADLTDTEKYLRGKTAKLVDRLANKEAKKHNKTEDEIRFIGGYDTGLANGAKVNIEKRKTLVKRIVASIKRN